MRMLLQQGSRRHVVDTRREDEGLTIVREGEPPLTIQVLARDAATLVLRVGARVVRARYARRGHDLYVQVDGEASVFHLVDEQEQEELGATAGSPVVRAPMPGKVLAVLAETGQSVRKGQAVVRMEAMKMEVDVAAPVEGTVASIAVKAGEQVAPDATLMLLTPAAG